MTDTKFIDIADALKTGREVEFSYNQKQYSITNGKDGWILCCDTDTPTLLKIICESDEISALPEKVKDIKIDGAAISDIFDNLQYNTLYIL